MSDDWKRLGVYVVQRRNELGYGSQAALEGESGVSYRTISRLETGNRIGKNNLRRVESALRWQLGSMERVLAGGEPVAVGGHPTPPVVVTEDPAAKGLIVSMSREELVRMAEAYAEAFGEPAAEEFLLRAAQIRRAAAAASDGESTAGLG